MAHHLPGRDGSPRWGLRDSAAIASTFNSNSINLVFGMVVPSLFVALQVSGAARSIDIAWLGGMTMTTVVLLKVRRSLGNIDGALLLGLYGLFLIVRVIVY